MVMKLCKNEPDLKTGFYSLARAHYGKRPLARAGIFG
jgi:hypothetical protein